MKTPTNCTKPEQEFDRQESCHIIHKDDKGNCTNLYCLFNQGKGDEEK